MLRIIAYGLLIYFVLRALGRIFFPVLVNGAARKMGREFERQQQQAQGSTRKQRREGDVTIEYDPKKGQSSDNKNVGEYVDFEEIDD